MSFITQDYKLNLIPGVAPVVVHASQYDKGSRTLNFSLFNGSTEITNIAALGVASAEIVGTKPDRKGFQFPATLGADTVRVDIEEQMTAVAGNVVCEIRFLDATDDVLGTANFILRVEPSALDDGVDISETVLPGYIDGAQRAARQAEDSATTAAESAEAATLAGTAATAAAESAEQDAQTASTAATTASEAATAADESATQAAQSAEAAADSEAWAVGQKNGVDVPSTAPQYQNNAKYYASKAMEGTPEGYEALVGEIEANQTGGWLRKNLLRVNNKGGTFSGGTITVNDDGTLTVDGTFTATVTWNINDLKTMGLSDGEDYILTGCPAGGGTSTYCLTYRVNGGSWRRDEGEGSTFRWTRNTGDNTVRLVIYAGTYNNLTFEPMVRSASIADASFMPYSPSNLEIQQELDKADLASITENENAGYLQKNLLNMLDAEGISESGLTSTVNRDGTVTLNGTNTEAATVTCLNYAAPKMTPIYYDGVVLFSGATGGSDATFRLNARVNDGSTTSWVKNYDGDTHIDLSGGKFIDRITIDVGAGADVSGVTVSPMVRPFAISDGTFTEHAPSNAKLATSSKRLASMYDLASGADLNTVTTRGEYLARTNAIAASLLNKPPITVAFRLTVESTRGESNANDVRQTAIAFNSATTYSRVSNDSGATWTAWTKHATGDTVPTNHAAAATTYGKGTATNYGHVRLSDDYTTSGGAAEDGVAASSKALNDAYNELKTSAGNTAYVANGASQILMNGNDVAVTFVHWVALLDGDLTAGESAISNSPIRAEVIEMIGTAPFTASIVSNKLTITATANIWVTWETILQA